MRQKRNNVYHLHIEIDKELYQRLKEILPTKGLVTVLLRRFINYYIDAYTEMSSALPDGGPLVSAANKLAKEDAEKRVIK